MMYHSCLHASLQPVVNNPVPDEQHCKNDESDRWVFNEDTELIESKVAQDAEQCNVFDLFDEFMLSSN